MKLFSRVYISHIPRLRGSARYGISLLGRLVHAEQTVRIVAPKGKMR